MYQRKDAYYTRAKVEGYRSRAAYKLLELTERLHLIRPRHCVIDLGAWPGGWLQVAAKEVGPGGKIIGVDLRAVDPLPQRNVLTIAGDIADPRTRAQVAEACGGEADVILSDLAPKLTGVRARDEMAVEALASCLLEFACETLKPGGTLVVKVFMNSILPAFLAKIRVVFGTVRTTRPRATRKASAEVYVIATGFRGCGSDQAAG